MPRSLSSLPYFSFFTFFGSSSSIRSDEGERPWRFPDFFGSAFPDPIAGRRCRFRIAPVKLRRPDLFFVGKDFFRGGCFLFFFAEFGVVVVCSCGCLILVFGGVGWTISVV